MALPTNTTTYGDISPRTGGRAIAKLLKRGQHLMVTERFGQVDPQPKNRTKTVKWRRYNSLARATAPLAEGVPPTGQKLTFTDVVATLEQYGDAVKITDVIADTHTDPVLNEAMDLCGEQAAETVEELRINFMKAGTNVYYANSVASRSVVNSPPVRGDFRRIYRYFKKYKAKEISKIIRASAMISTEPVAPAYFCLGHTDLDADIRGISGFVPAENYSNSTKILPGEIGKIQQFRIILTAMFDPWEGTGLAGVTYLSGGVAVGSSTACDVYPLLFIAQNAYGIVPLQGFQSMDIGVVNPGKKTKDDMLGQIGFVSWKTYQTGAILNQTWMARLECSATANPT
jgi:N4-gp56 family major capsid protein